MEAKRSGACFKMEIPGRRRNKQHYVDVEVSSEEVYSDGEDVKASVTVENAPEDISYFQPCSNTGTPNREDAKATVTAENAPEDISYCQPCLNTGTLNLAEGFCSECEEYMCAPCVRYHKNLKATKDHTVLHKDNVDVSAVKGSAKTNPSSKNGEEVPRSQQTTEKHLKSPQPQRGTDHGLSKGVHIGFICDGCDMDPIVGPRYKCRKCYEKDFTKGIDLCQHCKDDSLHSQHNSFLMKIVRPTDFDMKDFIKEIDNTDIRRGAKDTSKGAEVHDGIVCDGCMMSPIVGQRYKCEKCYKEHFFNGVDVCQACKDSNFHSHHNRFLKKTCRVTSAFKADGFHRRRREKVVHSGFSCDGCQMKPIVGPRYKCQKCYDKNFFSGVDLCQGCKDENIHIQHDRFIKKIDKPDSPLQTALEAFRQDKKDARMAHFGIICDGCGKNPIVGPRYKCQKCYDKLFSSGFDLCQDCKDNNMHSQHNRFMKKIA